MFNEKSPIWIKIFKVIVIVLFFVCLLSGVIMTAAEVFDDELAFVGLLIGVAAAFVELCVGMLAINYLSNVQRIREILEENQKNQQ